jgi:phosphodiesterase/alkaline phosphatase D-like protein
LRLAGAVGRFGYRPCRFAAAGYSTTTGLVHSAWTGVPTPTGCYVSTRLVADSADVKIVVSTNSDLSSPILTSSSVASSDRIARHTVTGLTANTTYYWGQLVGGVLDIGKIGKFKTAPAINSQASFRFAASSCAQVGSNHAVYDQIRSINPAFFIHMGDIHYADSTSTDEAVRQALYDDVLALSKPGQLFREVPCPYIYDDHDFCGNNSDSTSTGAAAAKASFRARVPVPVASGAGGANYYSFVYGRVRFIVTDLRSARSPVGNTDNSSKTMMGSTQKTWFKDELVAAVAANQVIVWVSSVPWLETTANNDDGWADYNTERVELADYMKANGVLGRILISSGDMHAIAWDTGGADYATGGGMPIPIFHSAPLDRTPSSKGGPYDAGPYQNNNQFGYFDVTDNGYAGVVFAYTGTNSVGGTVTTTSVTLGKQDYDSFTGGATAALAGHVAESGQTWAQKTGAATGEISIGTDSVFLSALTSGSAGRWYVQPFSAQDVSITSTMEMKSTPGSSMGLLARLQSGAVTAYYGGYSTSSGWTIRKYVAGVETTIGNSAHTWAAGVTHKVQFDVVGSTLTLTVDGVEVLSFTDTSITGAGDVGIRSANASSTSSETTGLHMHDYRAVAVNV